MEYVIPTALNRCSATCGYGIQTRAVECRDTKSQYSDNCDLSEMPCPQRPCDPSAPCPTQPPDDTTPQPPLVPDPVGLLDCVENKVTLPYMTSWVECTNSLGQNVQTSTDIINYRCKSVWEGKGLIPEVFYIKDCVIEKTGLPAKNVSAEVLGAYKECENNAPNPQQQRTKTAPRQQQQLRASSIEYKPVTQVQAPTVQQFLQPAQASSASQSQNFEPRQQFQTLVPLPVQSQIPVTIQGPIQQVFQAPAPRPVQQQFQAPAPRPVQQQFQVPVPSPIQQSQVTLQGPMQQQFQAPAPRPVQQQIPITFQQRFQAPPPRSVQPQAAFQQSSFMASPGQQIQTRPAQLTQQQVPITFSQQSSSAASGAQYQVPSSRSQYSSMMPSTPSVQRQPYSQQYFSIYPQAPLPNQQYTMNQPILSQKTATGPSYVSQQQLDAPRPLSIANSVPNGPYTYSFQINHPQRSVS